MSIAANCPSCGAPIRFANKASLFVVCEHCGCAVLRTNIGLENLGKVGELVDDGTPIQLGTSGAFQGRGFQTIGRLQVAYPDGYWNEWFLSFDRGDPGWLGEAQGNYTVSFAAQIHHSIPPFDGLQPGLPVALAGEDFSVKTVDEAQVGGAEGELPFRTQGGWKAPAADLVAPGNRFATIDYSDETPVVYLGWYVDFADLAFKNLRATEGW